MARYVFASARYSETRLFPFKDLVDGCFATSTQSLDARCRQLKICLQGLVRLLVTEYLPGCRLFSDATRDIDGIAPEIVDKLVFTEHAGDHRAGADADMQFQSSGIDGRDSVQQIAHVQS